MTGISTPLAPWLRDQLAHLLSPDERSGHAWLLHGPSGLGHYELALGLARSWLCESPAAQGIACGTCTSCHAIEVRAHADLHVLMPETVKLEMDWPLHEKAQADLDEKKRKPSKEIRVDDMKHALEFAQRTSARGGCKVILLFPAEHMNHYTANAVLKTLEEPPGDLRLVLATQDVQHLLPTLRSRCMSYAIAWPSTELATAWLTEQDSGNQPMAGESLQTLLQACSGRPAQALLMHQAGVTAARWNALPKELARGQGTFFEGWSLLQVIDTLQKLCHDQLLASVGAVPRFFAASSLSPPPEFEVLSEWSKELMRARATAEHPFQAGLFLEHHISRARVVLNSRP